MPPEDFEKLSRKKKRSYPAMGLSGAEYGSLVFVPPTKAGVEPKINPVDHFIGKGLEEQGYDFAEEADRATLACRASLVLNGLPPEPEELDAFLKDNHPDAYERLLNRYSKR